MGSSLCPWGSMGAAALQRMLLCTCLRLRPVQQREDELPTTLKTTSQRPALKTPELTGSAFSAAAQSDHSTFPFLQICLAFDGPRWNIFKEGQKPGRAEGTAEGISKNKISLKIRQGGGEHSTGRVRALRRMYKAWAAGRPGPRAHPTAGALMAKVPKALGPSRVWVEI